MQAEALPARIAAHPQRMAQAQIGRIFHAHQQVAIIRAGQGFKAAIVRQAGQGFRDIHCFGQGRFHGRPVLAQRIGQHAVAALETHRIAAIAQRGQAFTVAGAALEMAAIAVAHG